MIRRDEVYKIGKLGKPHGVKGEITFAITDDVFDRVDAEYLVLDIDGILVPFYLEEYRLRISIPRSRHATIPVARFSSHVISLTVMKRT